MKIIKIILILMVFFNPLVLASSQENNIVDSAIITEFAPFGTIDNQKSCKKDTETKFNCSFDKWIEIYNPTNQTINLADYNLKFGYSSTRDYYRSVQLEGVIKPSEYFIIGNKNISIQSIISSDLEIGSLQNISKKLGDFNSNVTLALFKNNQEIQKINKDFACSQISTISLNSNFQFACSVELWQVNEITQMLGSPRSSVFDINNIQEKPSSINAQIDQVLIDPITDNKSEIIEENLSINGLEIVHAVNVLNENYLPQNSTKITSIQSHPVQFAEPKLIAKKDPFISNESKKPIQINSLYRQASFSIFTPEISNFETLNFQSSLSPSYQFKNSNILYIKNLIIPLIIVPILLYYFIDKISIKNVQFNEYNLLKKPKWSQHILPVN